MKSYGYRASVWGDEKVLGANSGDGWRTLSMQLMPLNCTCKIVIVNFIIYTHICIYASTFLIHKIFVKVVFNGVLSHDSG